MYPLRASLGTTQLGELSTFHPSKFTSKSAWSSIPEQTKQRQLKGRARYSSTMRFIIPVLDFVNEGTANDTSASVEMGSDRSSIPRPLQIDMAVFFVLISTLKRPDSMLLSFDFRHPTQRPTCAHFDTRVFTFVFFLLFFLLSS